MDNNKTDFSNVCEILADLWMDYRSDEEFEEFIDYNDIGLPLAYAVTNGLVTVNKSGESLIEETFALLLGGLDLEDTGFESLDDILGLAE